MSRYYFGGHKFKVCFSEIQHVRRSWLAVTYRCACNVRNRLTVVRLLSSAETFACLVFCSIMSFDLSEMDSASDSSEIEGFALVLLVKGSEGESNSASDNKGRGSEGSAEHCDSDLDRPSVTVSVAVTSIRVKI